MRERKNWTLRRVERIRQYLLAWLEKSEVPADYWPIVGESTLNGFKLAFPQAARELAFPVLIHKRCTDLSIAVDYRDQTWDFIMWFDVEEARKSHSYICKICDKQGKKRFPLRDRLYADHLWEPLFDWVQKNFQADRMICLFESSGCTWVEIHARAEEEEYSAVKSFLCAMPVINKRASGLGDTQGECRHDHHHPQQPASAYRTG